MIKVKVSTSFPEWPLLRQTPGSKGMWGDCQFVLNEDMNECDYWVVCEGLLQAESTVCPRKNTILITWEPPAVKVYNEEFISQFGTVITCHRNISHPNVIYSQQGLPWHVGRQVKDGKNIKFSKDYDELNNIRSFNKDKLLSVICSSKDHTKGHKKRVEFAERLKQYFGEKVDVWGWGFQEIEDKWDAISRYKYHVVIENSSSPDYWTEKLSDAFLGGAHPFYYGCPNISEYFSEDSFTSIDINNFERSASIIEEAIANRKYEKSVDAILDARDLMLDKYNLFPMIYTFCKKNRMEKVKVVVDLEPERSSSKGIAKKILRVLSRG